MSLEHKTHTEDEAKQPPHPHSSPSPSPSTPKTLATLTFDNSVLRRLPVGRHGQRGTLFSLVDPTPVTNPHIVSLSPAALSLLDLSPSTLLSDPSTPLYLSGNLPLNGSTPASHCYCGHQFGAFAGQLGDGAVCYLGEVLNSHGQRWELQFKGSGLTPYSRSADGRKVLRSSMREYLASEHMDALGIPTTRSASLITSDTYIVRDQFYTGDVRRERASVITRLAPTFIRFGSFEVCKTRDPRTGASGPCVGRVEVIRQLMDYVASSFYPDIDAQYSAGGGEGGGSGGRVGGKAARDVAVYGEVVRRTARMIAAWQCVGFIHGVMNTDNMSIVGLTIDYGPYQWMDAYIPQSTSNTSDDQFRYAYERQRAIGKWDLGKLAEALAMMGEGEEGEGEGKAWRMKEMERVLEEQYEREFERAYYGRMRQKLGLKEGGAGGGESEVRRWVQRFLDVLELTCGDFTNSFRILSSLSLRSDNSAVVVDYLVQQSASLSTYLTSLAPRIDPDQLAYYEQVLASNPNVRDSSGLIEGEKQRAARRKTAATLTEQGKVERDRALWAAFIAEYRHAMVQQWGAEMESEGKRRRAMNGVNPKYVLRNWMAQVAIEKAEAGDYSECEQLLQVLRDPFAVQEDEEVVREGEEKAREVEDNKGMGKYTCKPPKNYENVLCSCSS